MPRQHPTTTPPASKHLDWDASHNKPPGGGVDDGIGVDIVVVGVDDGIGVDIVVVGVEFGVEVGWGEPIIPNAAKSASLTLPA